MKSNLRNLDIRFSKKDRGRFRGSKYCNICDTPFSPKMKRHLYCDSCRKKSDLLRFAECYPSIEDLAEDFVLAS